MTNGVRHADPPDPMDDVLEVLMKNGGECQSFHSFEDEMVSVDMDDEAVCMTCKASDNCIRARPSECDTVRNPAPE